MKDEIKVEYEQIKTTDAEIEARLFKALSMLIKEDDVCSYELRDKSLVKDLPNLES